MGRILDAQVLGLRQVAWKPGQEKEQDVIITEERQGRCHDQRLPKPGRPGQPAKPVTDTAAAARLGVTVLNGTQTAQLAATTATGLSDRGFKIAGIGDAPGSASSVIEYASASELAAARALQAQIASSVTLQQDPGLGGLTLILGSDFTALGPVPSPTADRTASARFTARLSTASTPAKPLPGSSPARPNGNITDCSARSCVPKLATRFE